MDSVVINSADRIIGNASGKELIEWITKWNHIVEPHVFTFSQPQIRSLLLQTCPSEWITFVDDQILSGNADMMMDKLLELLKISDPSIEGNDTIYDTFWPNSVIDYIKDAKRLNIPRHISGVYQYNNDILRSSQMKRKKYHEVELLSKMILKYAHDYDVKGIVDVGSGSGYLAVELSKYFPVLAIDGDESQIRHSQKRYSSFPANKITHVVQRLDSNSLFEILSEYDLIQVENGFEFRKCKSGKNKRNILITSLHACGDLSSHVLLNTFLRCSWIPCVISIGCCYQMLSPKGFPLSNLLKSYIKVFDQKYPFNNINAENEGLFIPTYRSLNCACQTMIGFSDKRIRDVWKAFAYRCLLEAFLENKNDKAEHSQPQIVIGTLKKDAFMEGFVNYAISAIPDLSSYKSQLEEFEKSSSYPILLGRIAFISTMRRFYGTVMESMLLYDRYLYLAESDAIEASLIPVFKHDISPRNIAVVGQRRA